MAEEKKFAIDKDTLEGQLDKLKDMIEDKKKVMAENKAIVDSIIDQLVVSIQEQRSIDSIAQVNGEISSGDVNVYTLSGKKVSRITKPGIYIINGKKMKLK